MCVSVHMCPICDVGGAGRKVCVSEELCEQAGVTTDVMDELCIPPHCAGGSLGNFRRLEARGLSSKLNAGSQSSHLLLCLPAVPPQAGCGCL